MKKVLVGSPVHQKPEILAEFLKSLKRLRRSDAIQFDYFFVDDNRDEASSLILREFAMSTPGVTLAKSPRNDHYECNDVTHFWREDLIWKVAAFKNLMIDQALKGHYDSLFLIDSDIVLHPDTLSHLVCLEKDIVSEIFWTRWQPGQPPMPQVWVSDHYTLFAKRREERLEQQEILRRQTDFLNMLRQPGVYEVGGLGACTLISQKALKAGASFKEIKNLSWWGEDRHFCIRAGALGLSLFVDTHYPAYHIYRESDLAGVADYIARTTG